MASQAFETFSHVIQDSVDLINHFDVLNRQLPPPEIEVLKRASLVMALAALETYFEDRIAEAVDATCAQSRAEDRLKTFYKQALEVELKSFHSPNVDRVKLLFTKYLNLDVTEGWSWNNCNPEQAKIELDRIVKKEATSRTGHYAHYQVKLRPMQSKRTTCVSIYIS